MTTCSVKKIITVADCEKNPKSLYVFGDNTVGKGKAGQAAIRDCINSFGIPTKKLPSMRPGSFFSDSSEDEVVVLSKLRELFKVAKNYEEVIFPEDGLGTGLAKMRECSPKLFKTMNAILVEHFNLTDYEKFL